VGTDAAFAPFGEQYVGSGFDSIFTGSAFQDKTGDLRDFLAREYHATQGRWITPDPAGLAAVDPTDPQTWNRYAYVRNNPLALIDPTGLDPCVNGINPVTGNICTTVTGTSPSTASSLNWVLSQIYFQWYFGALGYPSPRTGSGGGPGAPPPQKPPVTQLTSEPCIPASAATIPGQPNLLQGAVALTQVAARLTGKTIGIGLGGGGGFRLGPPFLPGGQVSLSAVVASDRNGNSFLVSAFTPQLALMASNQLPYEYGAAANFGVQLVVNSQSPNQLPSVSASGSYQNFALDLNSSGFAVTAGAGVGARFGAGAGPAPSVAVPICHE
jgi:RHS repeat-associated protein